MQATYTDSNSQFSRSFSPVLGRLIATGMFESISVDLDDYGFTLEAWPKKKSRAEADLKIKASSCEQTMVVTFFKVKKDLPGARFAKRAFALSFVFAALLLIAHATTLIPPTTNPHGQKILDSLRTTCTNQVLPFAFIAVHVCYVACAIAHIRSLRAEQYEPAGEIVKDMYDKWRKRACHFEPEFADLIAEVVEDWRAGKSDIKRRHSLPSRGAMDQ